MWPHMTWECGALYAEKISKRIDDDDDDWTGTHSKHKNHIDHIPKYGCIWKKKWIKLNIPITFTPIMLLLSTQSYKRDKNLSKIWFLLRFRFRQIRENYVKFIRIAWTHKIHFYSKLSNWKPVQFVSVDSNALIGKFTRPNHIWIKNF